MKHKEKAVYKSHTQGKQQKNRVLQKPAKSKNKVNPGAVLLLVLIGIGVVVLTGVLLMSVSQEQQMTNSGTLPKLDPSQYLPTAKDFTLKDTLGFIHKLSDNGGRPVLLDFTASWCGWCKKQTPAVQKLYGKYGDKVQFYAIDVNEPLEIIAKFKLEEGSKWPFLIDESGQVASLYGVKGYPHYILLDKDGTPYRDQSGYSETFFEDFSGSIEQIVR